MENLYRLDQYPTTSCASDHDIVRLGNYNSVMFSHGDNIYASSAAAATRTTTTTQFPSPVFGSMLHQFETGLEGRGSSEISDVIRSQISNHPRYPNLVSAFIECQKVGAPPEMASIFEEISRGIYSRTSRSEIGADPELDQFMEQYCQVLGRYKEELSRPFNEATTFLNNIESQLSNLCNIGTFSRTSFDDPSDEAAGTSEEELSHGEAEAPECQESLNSNIHSGDQQGGGGVKGMLMRKYSGHLSSLRKEFLKKRKKGKLPKDARIALLDWWNSHYRWPYPTEEEKAKLSEETGLGQRQISNWFINQRKRHWKPSEDMRFALMEGVTTTTATATSANIINNDMGELPMYLDTADGDHNH